MVPVVDVQKDPAAAMAVNAGGTRALLDAIAASGQRPWIFYASTCHVYAPKPAPLAEDDPIAPISLYGETKLAGEQACAPFADALPICIGRIFSYWHETQKAPFLYPSLRARLSREDLSQPFALRGADSQRDFLNAEEVCALIVALMARRSTGTFNIASGKPTSIRDFVQAMAPRPLDIRAEGGGEILVADTTRLQRELTP
jgi:UDP-glucose 4-epimerase/GDP-4-dehydro-6-deoxy-D-mannose reductase